MEYNLEEIKKILEKYNIPDAQTLEAIILFTLEQETAIRISNLIDEDLSDGEVQ